MNTNFIFLPQPRRILMGEEQYKLNTGKLIWLNAPDPQHLRFAAQNIQHVLRTRFSLDWTYNAGRSIPMHQVGLTLVICPQAIHPPQGYHLQITPTGITIRAHDAAGALYGVYTLIQLLQQINAPEIPCLDIVDWPDFPARGVMLDISRDKVPTMKTLYALVDRLASWKINQLQLYTEHTFAYRNHPEVWREASPMTGEEVLTLDAYCRERHIELVPNQNSFGHLERWLKHERYAPLAEVYGEFEVPWGTIRGPFSLSPVEAGSIALIRELYDELLPHFSSHQFNVGCDETFDLGRGKSKALCEARGVGRVYLDFLMEIYREVTRHGRTMQFWGDIVLRHPDLVAELPPNVIALEWGYSTKHHFDEYGAKFAAAGVPFYVCPGTSSWNTIAGRTDNALGNLLSAAENGIKHAACGYLNTDWGDNGHWQYLPVSYLGLGMGAAYAWCLETNRDSDVAAAIGRFAFDDPSGTLGRVAYDLGNIYQAPGKLVSNASLLFWILQSAPDVAKEHIAGLTAENFHKTLQAIEAAMSPMESSDAGTFAPLAKRELTTAGCLLRYACHYALWLLDPASTSPTTLRQTLEALIEEHRALWLARNRPGGLKDSLARFKIPPL